jgi:prostaglandin-E synthase
VIPKKESGPFWPRLLKSDKKVHWVKIDFNKWKDEDDVSEDEGGQFNFNDVSVQFLFNFMTSYFILF